MSRAVVGRGFGLRGWAPKQVWGVSGRCFGELELSFFGGFGSVRSRRSPSVVDLVSVCKRLWSAKSWAVGTRNPPRPRVILNSSDHSYPEMLDSARRRTPTAPPLLSPKPWARALLEPGLEKPKMTPTV